MTAAVCLLTLVMGLVPRNQNFVSALLTLVRKLAPAPLAKSLLIRKPPVPQRAGGFHLLNDGAQPAAASGIATAPPTRL